MASTWGYLTTFLSPFILPLVLHCQTAPDLPCHVFLQREMEEAQLGLQDRDEVINKVGKAQHNAASHKDFSQEY